MMLAFSIGSVCVAALAIFLTTKIKDEVFQVGMAVVALVFTLVTLICAPWTLKLLVVVIPLFLGNLNSISS